MNKPILNDGESIASYLDRLDAWKAEGHWVPAAGGTEVPFRTRGGARLLYCWQPRSGRHAYMDCDSDIILTDEEAQNLLGR
jgi:hypothetical protein